MYQFVRIIKKKTHKFVNMAANNMLPPPADFDAEDKAFQAEVEQVKKWWSDPRWRYTKRPFTADQIVQKRGNLPIEYPGKVW